MQVQPWLMWEYPLACHVAADPIEDVDGGVGLAGVGVRFGVFGVSERAGLLWSTGWAHNQGEVGEVGAGTFGCAAVADSSGGFDVLGHGSILRRHRLGRADRAGGDREWDRSV